MNPGGSTGAGGSIAPQSASAGGVSRSLAASSSSAPLSSLQHAAEENLFALLAEDLTFSHDAKLETQRALIEELLESLRKEEKLLDADAWKYAAPRSQLQFTSMSGIALHGSHQESQLRVNKRKRPYDTGRILNSQAVK